MRQRFEGEARRVTCRVCGAWGYEDADDPCPGLCPRCFNRVLYQAHNVLLVDAADEDLTTEQVVARHLARLRAAGLSEASIARFRSFGEAMIASGEEQT